MQYTINKLAKLSNTTTRTLRFYDTIGLLKPACVSENGYRCYEDAQLLKLQQILFFKELGFELKYIQNALSQEDFDQRASLKAHKIGLLENMKRIRSMVQTIDKTLQHLDGQVQLSDDEIFKGLNEIPAQAELQTKMINTWTQHFGEEEGRKQLKEAVEVTRHWTIEETNHYFARAQKIVDQIVLFFKEGRESSDPMVQELMQTHCMLLQEAQTVTKEFYHNLGNYLCAPEQRKAFDAIQEGLPEYFAQAMNFFAEHNLK